MIESIPKSTLLRMSLIELKALARELQKEDCTHAPRFIPRQNRSVYAARIEKYFEEREARKTQKTHQMSIF